MKVLGDSTKVGHWIGILVFGLGVFSGCGKGLNTSVFSWGRGGFSGPPLEPSPYPDNWFKAETFGNTAISNIIQPWVDQRGGLSLIATGSPSYAPSGGPQSFPAVTFSGTTATYFKTSTSGFPAALNNLVIFLVAASDRLNYGSFFGLYGTNPDCTSTNKCMAFSQAGSAGYGFQINNGTATMATSPIISSLGEFSIHQLVWGTSATNAGTSTLSYTLRGSTMTAAAPTGAMSIQGSMVIGDTSNSFKGSISEILVYRSALDTVQIANIQSYLQIKYGIH